MELTFDEEADPPIDADPEVCVVTSPRGVVRTFTAFMTSDDTAIPLDDRLVQNVTLKITGKIVKTGP